MTVFKIILAASSFKLPDFTTVYKINKRYPKNEFHLILDHVIITKNFIESSMEQILSMKSAVCSIYVRLFLATKEIIETSYETLQNSSQQDKSE